MTTLTTLTTTPTREGVDYHLSRDWRTRLYTATLLGGEYANCYGQGPTPEQAEISLRMAVRVRRRNTP